MDKKTTEIIAQTPYGITIRRWVTLDELKELYPHEAGRIKNVAEKIKRSSSKGKDP